ncbi:MAG: WYL domain-containing protein [Actinomycetota bacterium]|nr:WYL domain-containing protein [Actinomycetota bacterium]MDP8954061.1 WYL domain-containing protein [Actinomycetota bacterium]
MVSRLERLLNLTAALLTTTRPLTRDEIYERVPGYPVDDAKGSARRAFERDKESLREMGIPVETEEVPFTEPPLEGYRIPRDQYALRDPGLEPDELAALHLAAAAVRIEGLRGTEALWKLGGLPAKADDALAAIPTIPQLVPLFVAVGGRRPVSFTYRGERRSVDPHRLSFTRGRWYLDGYDHDRGAARQFRLDRLEGDVALGEPDSFERPAEHANEALPPWQMGDEAPLEARVRIDADLAGWGVDHLGPEAVRARHPDGSVEVVLTVTNRDAFRSFVLGFLDHAEVLGPPELRHDLVTWLTNLAADQSPSHVVTAR